jgi:hypothetical protein
MRTSHHGCIPVDLRFNRPQGNNLLHNILHQGLYRYRYSSHKHLSHDYRHRIRTLQVQLLLRFTLVQQVCALLTGLLIRLPNGNSPLLCQIRECLIGDIG